MNSRTRRRKHDAYMTPEFAVQELLKRIPLAPNATVLEPCSGDGVIAVVLIGHGCDVATNDIDPERPADTHHDAADPSWWQLGLYDPRFHWVITNPPFNQAAKILPLAYDHCKVGMAMLLRYSYLEPCDDRGPWLAANPPSMLISVPRISFTGDGKTDSVATAWMVWLKQHTTAGFLGCYQAPIQVVPKCK